VLLVAPLIKVPPALLLALLLYHWYDTAPVAVILSPVAVPFLQTI
jgi:hypothetical protein